jgi:hypothetical protein
MQNHTLRLYLATATLLVFLLLWATVAARPWSAPAKRAADPRLVALAERQRQLQREAATVKRVLARRWAVYRRELRGREREIVAAKQQHARQVEAARAAAARIAAAEAALAARQTAATQAAASAPFAPVVHTSAATAPTAAPAAPTVVTLPPQVQVVTLPPVTSSSSSRQP